MVSAFASYVMSSDTKNDGNRIQGAHPSGKPGKVGEFDIGQGKVMEIRKSLGNCGLPVVCYCSCSSDKINLT